MVGIGGLSGLGWAAVPSRKNKNMKTLKSLLAIAALSCALAFTAAAQSTNSAPLTPQAVLGNIGTYFTSFNTSLTWTNTPVSIWTGANYQSSVNTSSELGISYDLWRPSAETAFAPEAVVRNAGIAGTVVSAQGGLGVSLFHYDVKVNGYLDAGYNLPLNTPLIEFGVRLEKKMTVSTYAGVGLGFAHYFKGPSQNTPTITAHIGWTF